MTVDDSRVPAIGRVGWVKHEIEAMLSTDEQYEEIIVFLQKKIKISKEEQRIIDLLNNGKSEVPYNATNAEELQQGFEEDCHDNNFHWGLVASSKANWQRIFEELKR